MAIHVLGKTEQEGSVTAEGSGQDGPPSSTAEAGAAQKPANGWSTGADEEGLLKGDEVDTFNMLITDIYAFKRKAAMFPSPY